MAERSTVYIETTIVSYLTAWPSKDIVRLSHQIITKEWWRDARPQFDIRTSVFALEEANAGDPVAAQERLNVLRGIPLLTVDAAVVSLASELEIALSLPTKARTDAAHLAVSAVHGIDFLLTWNCTHLANAFLANKIEEACTKAGFKAPRVLTPELLPGNP